MKTLCGLSRAVLLIAGMCAACMLQDRAAHAATGSWSAGASNLVPPGAYVGIESWADGPGSHVSPWIATLASNGTVAVSATPPTAASWISYGAVPFSVGTLENLVCSNAGIPVAYAVTTPTITHQVYYYDTGTATFKLSFIPNPGSPAANLNNTQQGTYVGTLSNDIHGNITLEILSYFWRSTDDGKTFVFVTDSANFIQPPPPNNLPFGSVVTGISYGTNAPSVQSISGAPYGASTAPWGEMYIGKEFYSWRSYDDGQTWELIDPLFYQPLRETVTGLPWYPNSCQSFAMFGKGDGAAFTTDAEVMLNAFRMASYVNSSYPKFFRILPTGQIIHATNGDLDPVSSPYVAQGYTLSQGSGMGMITTKSGDTFGSIVWNTLPAGNPLNRNHSEFVKWDCDTKLWSIISPPAGTQPAAISSYTFARTAGDGDHFFASSGATYQWTPNLGTNLRPAVTLNPAPGNFPLTVATDPVTHVASATPGNSFTVSDDHTPAGNLIYSWSFRGQGRVTFDNPANLNATAYFSNPGYYVLTLTADDGSLSGAMSVIVKVTAPGGGGGSAPAIAATGQPVNQVLTVGQPVVVTVTASGSNLKYRWKRNGMEIVDTVPGSTSYVLQGQALDYSGTSSNQLTIAAGRAVDDGAIYYCEVSNEYGRVVSNSAAIGNAPAIVQGPVDNTTANGDLSVSASGTQPLQWQWYAGTPGSGTKVAGAQSSVFHTTTAGTYYVVITNIFGATTSGSAQIGSFAGNSVTLNLSGALNNGTLPPGGSASFLVGTTIGIGTEYEPAGNWSYFTKWNSGSAHVTAAPGYLNSPQSKFIIDSSASGTVSLTTSAAFFTSEYVLTVKNGFGTSSAHQHRFHAGDTLCVQADTAPPGLSFNGWIVTKGGTLSGGFVANPGGGKSLTKFIFPANDVELVATYAGGNSYTIGGTIAAAGGGISNVSVVLSSGGSTVQTVLSDVNGMYTFSALADGTHYTITPSKSGYVFTPGNASGTLSGANVTANFIAFTATPVPLPPNIISVQVMPKPVAGTSAAAQAAASDPNSPAQPLTYNWTATGPATVTFNPNNSTSANASTLTFSKAGNYTITLMVSNTSMANSASTSVTVNQTLSALAVAPPSANVVINGTQQFSASGTDQFNAAMSPQPAVTWSLSAGSGSVDSTGLYTAPNSAGTCTVQASNGAVTSTALVTVTATLTPATIKLGNLLQAYDGNPKTPSVATNPANLKVVLTYDGNSLPPSQAGSYVVVATINDANYQGTTSAIMIIDRTTLSSSIVAAPNPVSVLQTTAVSVVASNSNNDPLTYTWNFGDGSQGSGASVSHSYDTPGIYHATVAIDNGLAPISDSVDVSVTAAVALIGEGPDSDGDGFSDSFEALAGTNAASADSTPTGKQATAANVGALTLYKAQIKLNFAKPGNDSISFHGTLSIPQGLNPAGIVVLIDVGGVLKRVSLGSKGMGKVGNDSFKLALKAKRGIVQANPAAAFSAAFDKGAFAATLARESQLTNGSFSSAMRSVTFALVFDGAVMKKQLTMLYTAKLNKSGAAK